MHGTWHTRRVLQLPYIVEVRAGPAVRMVFTQSVFLQPFQAVTRTPILAGMLLRLQREFFFFFVESELISIRNPVFGYLFVFRPSILTRYLERVAPGRQAWHVSIYSRFSVFQPDYDQIISDGSSGKSGLLLARNYG